MAVQNINPTQTKAWGLLKNHFTEMETVKMQDLFKKDPLRAEKFHIKWNHFLLDYSKNRIDSVTMQLLLDLAKECGLKEAIASYFDGDKINQTENRAVLHTALRTSITNKIAVDGKNIVPEIVAVQEKMKSFSESIIQGTRKGYTGKSFTDVVNIGIGGSDLGPDMVVEALKYYKNHLNIHFISNIDGDHVVECLKNLNPATTLFVIVSKTFSTQETLTNAETIKKWFLSHATEKEIEKHFVAVSTNIEKVTEFGIATDAIFPMWDWTGGRFSLWSAVGLTITIAIGYENFEQLLKGAQQADSHFKEEAFDKNIPVVLALLSIWYNNFFGSETEAIITYSQYLNKLVPYLQQAIMESNGKSCDRNGNAIDYQTGTVVWGATGTNSQHAFFQLLHQGTKLIPADFIGFVHALHGNKEHHDKLLSHFFAQTEALLNGKTATEVAKDLKEKESEFLIPFQTFSGNKPTNTILIDALTPETLGTLIAIYEHKLFVQGIIWNIFSYDQWGVELGKVLATAILKEIKDKEENAHDASTSFLIDYYMKCKS